MKALTSKKDRQIAMGQLRTVSKTEKIVFPIVVTGKPTAYEDAAFWTNEAMAQYFGVKSVRVE